MNRLAVGIATVIVGLLWCSEANAIDVKLLDLEYEDWTNSWDSFVLSKRWTGVTISPRDFRGLPDWRPGTGALPLTLDEAIAIAERWLKDTLSEKGRLQSRKLESLPQGKGFPLLMRCELRDVEHEGQQRWMHYLMFRLSGEEGSLMHSVREAHCVVLFDKNSFGAIIRRAINREDEPK